MERAHTWVSRQRAAALHDMIKIAIVALAEIKVVVIVWSRGWCRRMKRAMMGSQMTIYGM